MKNKKVLGILGGMGHMASAHFFELMVRYQQREFGFVHDADFYKSVIYNIALRELDNVGIINEDIAKQQLIDEAKKLAAFPVDIMAIPCNSAHYFFDDIQKAVGIPMVSIIKETAEAVKRSGEEKVGIICTSSTRALRLYENALSGIETISPVGIQQLTVDNIILNIQAGWKEEETKQVLLKIVDQMLMAGAGGVIVGCTELSIPLHDSDRPLFDSSKILVEGLFKAL